MGRLHDEIEELFSDLWQVPRFAGLRRAFRPAVDCFRTEDPPELTIVVELAGVPPEAVELFALDGELVLTGERRRPRPDRRPSYFQMEIEYGPFERRIALPDGADTGAAQATYREGLLTVVLPIRPLPAPPRKVSIQLSRSE